jgi:hypothetical protein
LGKYRILGIVLVVIASLAVLIAGTVYLQKGAILKSASVVVSIQKLATLATA